MKFGPLYRLLSSIQSQRKMINDDDNERFLKKCPGEIILNRTSAYFQ